MQAAKPLPRGFRVRVGNDGHVDIDASARCRSHWSENKHYLIHGRLEAGVDGLGVRPLEEAAVDLRGSFAVAEIDGSTVRVATDRTASRKVFLGSQSGVTTLSTDLHNQPLSRHALSPMGIGCYLSSLGMIDGLTAFEGIESVPSASIAEISAGTSNVRQFWAYEPDPQTDRSFDDAVDQLRHLLRDVTVRAAGDCTVFVSLSGGQDSRSQLAYVVAARGEDAVTALTYHRGREYAGTDLEAARSAAEHLGVRHEVVSAYNGSLVDVIRANARLGQGVAQFCDEVDAWVTAAPLLEEDPDAVLLAGDLFVYFQAGLRPDVRSHMWRHGLRNTESSRWFFDSLPRDAGESMVEAWDTRWNAHLARFEAMPSPSIARQYTYLDHRVGQTLNSWRDRFQAAFVHTVTPYTQPEFLEFMRRLPWEWRLGPDSVYRKALAFDFPGPLGAPSSENDWNRPSWPREIREQRDDLVDLVRNEPSRLDEYIPPEVVIALIDRVATHGGRSLRATSVREHILEVAPVRRAYRSLRHRVRREASARARTKRSPERMVRDVLTLRTAISEMDRASGT